MFVFRSTRIGMKMKNQKLTQREKIGDPLLRPTRSLRKLYDHIAEERAYQVRSQLMKLVKEK